MEIIVEVTEAFRRGDHHGALERLAREGVILLATIDEARQAVDAYIQAAQAAITQLEGQAAANDAQPILDDVAAATAQLPQPPA